jgi:hypothetical protein
MPLLRESLLDRQKNAPDAWFTFNAQSVLGGCLLAEGKYGEAEPLLVAGYEGTNQRAAAIPSTSRIRIPEALERLVQLYTAWDKRDEAAKWRAADPLSLALLAASREQHRAAAELYREVFQHHSELADDPANGNRYNAACAAARVAHAEGADAAESDTGVRDGWRKQSLDWLRSDLAAWKERLAGATDEVTAQIVTALQHWQQDPDLDRVRDEDALAALPDDERAAWQALWSDVAALIDSVAATTTAGAPLPAAPIQELSEKQK